MQNRLNILESKGFFFSFFFALALRAEKTADNNVELPTHPAHNLRYRAFPDKGSCLKNDGL